MATQAQYDNALRNAGGDENNPMFQQWLSTYGGVTGTPAVEDGNVAANNNAFMTQQAIAPFLANLPNYANMVGQRTENIGQQLQGELPQDVLNQIMQQGAERGIMTGAQGSPNANSAMLRALGLDSLQMQQMGSQGLSTAIADTPVPELFNPMSLYVPTVLGQQQEAAVGRGMAAQQSAQQQQQYAANNAWNRPRSGGAFTMSNAQWGGGHSWS
jgi:hypothetical protein